MAGARGPLRLLVRPPQSTGAAPERVLAVDLDSPEVLIGRDEACAVRLPFPTVSVRHATLTRAADGDWWVTDLGSTNGTFLADRRLPPHAPALLRDRVRVADVHLSLAGAPTGQEGGVESTATFAQRLIADFFAAGGGDVPFLAVTSGPSQGNVFPLRVVGRAYRIGRASTCEFVLPDDDLSREHAAFERRWDGVFLRDLASRNGVYAGGARVEAERRLLHGERIELGSTSLRFEDPEAVYLANLARLSDAPMPVLPAVEQGPAAVEQERGVGDLAGAAQVSAVTASPAAVCSPLPALDRAQMDAPPTHLATTTRTIRVATYTAVTVLVGGTGLVLWLLLGGWQ